MTAILACLLCHSDIRDAGTTVCTGCERRDDPQRMPAAEHCVRCGLGWRKLDEHNECATCASG